MGPLREGTALRWVHVGRVLPPMLRQEILHKKEYQWIFYKRSMHTYCLKRYQGKVRFETSACGCPEMPAFHWYTVMSHETTWESTVLRWVHGVRPAQQILRRDVLQRKISVRYWSALPTLQVTLLFFHLSTAHGSNTIGTYFVTLLGIGFQGLTRHRNILHIEIPESRQTHTCILSHFAILEVVPKFKRPGTKLHWQQTNKGKYSVTKPSNTVVHR